MNMFLHRMITLRLYIANQV